MQADGVEEFGAEAGANLPTNLCVDRTDSGEVERHVAALDVAHLGLPADGPWRAGLSAVLEADDGTRAFWALAHPPGQPDFHHADAFALSLPPPKA